MDVNLVNAGIAAVTALLAAWGTYKGVTYGYKKDQAAAAQAAIDAQLRHEQALSDARLQTEKLVAEAKRDQNSATLQASQQLFTQLREFIKDLQDNNNALVQQLAKERGEFRAAQDLERARCDKEIEAINKELDAANDRWRKTDRLSLEQEGKIHDLELAVILERRSPTNEPVATGRRATDLAPTAL